MPEFLHSLTGYGFHYVARSGLALTALSVAALVADRLLRRIGPQAQHFAWVAALLLGILLPLAPVSGLVHLPQCATDSRWP